jgi:hypothetical protein
VASAANGMVRLCSCPSSKRCCGGTIGKRSTAMSNKPNSTFATMGIDSSPTAPSVSSKRTAAVMRGQGKKVTRYHAP